MRYFNEDGSYVGQDFDRDNFIEKEADTNNITFTWEVDKEAVTEEVIDWESPDHSAKQSHIEVIEPEEGHWGYEGDYSDDDVKFPSDNNPHDKAMHEVETVSIIREMTEEEKEEKQREEEEREAEQQEAQERAEQLETFIKTDSNGITLNTDVPNEDNAAHAGGPYITVTGDAVTCSTAEDADNKSAIVNIEYLEQYINKVLKK